MGARVAALCDSGAAGHIHSVFARVVNVTVAGEIIAVAGCGEGGASRFLNLTDRGLSRFQLERGQACGFSRESVQIGNLSIPVADTPVWRGLVDADTRGSPAPETVACLRAAVDRGAPDALDLAGLPVAAMRGLCHPVSAASAVHALLGLGPGLTPAGDDLLLGFVAGMNHLRPAAHADSVRTAILQSLGRTADISAQLLRDAVRCEYHETMQRVLADLCADRAEALGLSVPRLLAVGATSGACMAHGLLLALAGHEHFDTAKG